MRLLPALPGASWAAGCIYYILSGETGRIKIGFTKGDPGKRLRALQTGSPTQIGIIAVHPGTPELEKRLHRQFAADRVHGEWFDFSDELLAHVAETCALTIAIFDGAGQPPPSWATEGRRAILELCALAEAERETLQ
jgi:hypothetical protein